MSNADILSALVPVIVLLLLGIVTAIASRVVGVSPIVGYILLGFILRAIGEPTVPTQSSIKLFSELGILFLLFEIGLHFSAKQIREHASDIFAFGPLQVVFATVGLSAIALSFGIAVPTAALIGGILSLSSTAVVERLIVERRQRSCPVGLTAVAILVFQDLAAILLLVVEGALGAGKAVGAAVAIAVAKATFAFIVTIFGARLVAEPLLNLIAHLRNDEVFTATALLIALAAGWATGEVGLSFTLGAFLGGVTLAETPFRALIAAEIRPFRGLFLGLFFVSIGLSLDVAAIGRGWVWIAVLAAGLIIAKAIANVAAGLVFKWSVPGSIQLGFLLAQGSEFAFVILSLPAIRAMIGESRSSLLIVTVALSLAVTPNVAELGRRLAGRIRQSALREDDPELTRRAFTAQVLIVGMGRVGRAMADALIEFGIAYHGIERDPLRLRQSIADGYEASFGNADDVRLWKSLDLRERKFIVSTAPDIDVLNQTAQFEKQHFPNLKRFLVVSDREPGRRFERSGMSVIVDRGDPASHDVVQTVLSELGVSKQDIDDWTRRRLERAHRELTLEAA